MYHSRISFAIQIPVYPILSLKGNKYNKVINIHQWPEILTSKHLFWMPNALITPFSMPLNISGNILKHIIHTTLSTESLKLYC